MNELNEREAWRAYACAYLAGAWRSGVDRVEDASDAADAMLELERKRFGKPNMGDGLRDPEIVVCAAIRLPDGRIFRGHRHTDCIMTAKQVYEFTGRYGDARWHPSMCEDQGFITSRNRYVSREEALRLQLAAGIPSASPSGYRAGELFSEDLY